MRRWKQGVAVILLLVVAALLASSFTPYGFALAGDVKTEVAGEVKPLKDAVASIDTKLANQEGTTQRMLTLLNELKAASVAENIDRLIRRRCMETDPNELRSLRIDIESGKQLYFVLMERRQQYTEPTCAEIRKN